MLPSEAPRVIFTSLRGYQRSWAPCDLLAAVTLLAIAVPEQLATARLAGMPPITGLYAFVAAATLFALLGSSRQLSVGADSTIAPLFAIGVAHLAPIGSEDYENLVGILAIAVGVIVALVWLLRLGWIAELLSTPIITGFLAGVAVIIAAHQLPDLLGLPPASGNTAHRIAFVIDHIGQTNAWTLAIGVGVLAIVVGTERVDRRIPGALVAVVAATVLVAACGLKAQGVAVLGPLATGVPHFGVGGLTWSTLTDVAPLAGVVALVIVTQTAATTRAFADQGGYEVDLGRDLLAVGAGSIAAGLSGAFPVNASPPRTAAVAAASGRTQAAGLGAAAMVVVLIPAAGLLQDLPLAALAGVLLVVATRIIDTRDLVAIVRFDRVEAGLAVLTMAVVALVGVQQGIAAAVGLAILDRTRLTARPKLHVLGRIPGTTSWAPVSRAGHAAQVPGVLVILFATPLWYANAARFRVELHAALGRAIGPTTLVVLDGIGMTDLDYTGSRSLGAALDLLDRHQITFALARVGDHVRESLAHSDLLERIGEDRLYTSVDEAVRALGGDAISTTT